MRIAVSTDERTGVADAVVELLRARGHEPLLHGALAVGQRTEDRPARLAGQGVEHHVETLNHPVDSRRISGNCQPIG